MTDLFPLDPEPGPGFPVHEINVLRIEYADPADQFGIDPTVCEYEIDHMDCTLLGDECIVHAIVTDIGLHQALFGVWDKDHRIEAKTYRVRGWASVSPATPNGPAEYDAGIEEVDDDEPDPQ